MSLTSKRIGVGAGLGALIGAGIGALDDTDVKTGKKYPKNRRIANVLANAVGGAISGGTAGYGYDSMKRIRQMTGIDKYDIGNLRKLKKKPKYRKGAKHEAAKRWGVKEKDILKEAMYSAFVDELEKIAIVGALLGGAAGYHFTPGGTKTKLLGTAVGAGTGAVLGSALKGMKRAVWDDYYQREHDQLYGYIPGGPEGYPR